MLGLREKVCRVFAGCDTPHVAYPRRFVKGAVLTAVLFTALVGPLVIPLDGALAQAPREAELIAKSGFLPDELGYLVVELDSGVTRAEHRAEAVFIPASMVKLATAFAALETLGPNYRFQTPVLASGSGNTLDLHFSGSGDPVLVQEDLAALAWSLKQNTGTRTVGRFTYDSDALPFIPAIDPSDDTANSYNPPVAALSFNFNRQWLKWERMANSRAMLVQVLPDLGHVLPGVAALRSADGRPVQVLAGPVTRLLIEPQVPSAGSRHVAVHDPALRTALMLRRLAQEAGLALPLPMQAARPAGAKPIASVESRPMVEIADAVLRYSNNLTAELVGLAVATELGRRPGTLREGALAVRQWLGQSVSPLAGKGMVWVNQSGLSGQARLSPRALLSLLWHARNREYEGRPFLDLLHEPKWSEKDNVISFRAKSGTMSYARGQAGVLTGREGRKFLFVLMHTDFGQRSRFEGDPMRFSNPVRRRAGQWLWRARTLEQDLIRHWTETL